MRDGVLVSSVRQCEIYIAVKYTQLAAADKNAAGDGGNYSEKPFNHGLSVERKNG